MAVAGLPAGTYEVSVDGAGAQEIAGGEARRTVTLRVAAKKTVRVAIKKAS
jgi:hypothetical protein